MTRQDLVNQKRKVVILGVFVLLVFVAIGYAALTGTLNINGTAEVSSETWNVHFENVAVASGSVTATGANAAQVSAGDNKLVTYNVTLEKPGDFYEFTVDAVNSGSLDAMIAGIESKYNGTTIGENTLPSYLEYSVTYADGVAIANNHALDHGQREKYKVRIYYKYDITPEELYSVPSGGLNANFTFKVVYSQTDNNKVARPVPVTAILPNIYSFHENWTDYRNQAVTTLSPRYNTPSEALAEAETNEYGPYFLAYKVENDIITEEFVGFKLDDTYYYLLGAHDESSYSASDRVIYKQNIETLLSAYDGASECNGYDSNRNLVHEHSTNVNDYLSDYYISCSREWYKVEANSSGTVSDTSVADTFCAVNSGGYSRCYYGY